MPLGSAPPRLWAAARPATRVAGPDMSLAVDPALPAPPKRARHSRIGQPLSKHSGLPIPFDREIVLSPLRNLSLKLHSPQPPPPTTPPTDTMQALSSRVATVGAFAGAKAVKARLPSLPSPAQPTCTPGGPRLIRFPPRTAGDAPGPDDGHQGQGQPREQRLLLVRRIPGSRPLRGRTRRLRASSAQLNMPIRLPQHGLRAAWHALASVLACEVPDPAQMLSKSRHSECVPSPHRSFVLLPSDGMRNGNLRYGLSCSGWQGLFSEYIFRSCAGTARTAPSGWAPTPATRLTT